MALDLTSFDALNRLIGVAELRQQVISRNIAHVNTPGYQAHEVRFEELLAAGAGTSIAELPTPQVSERSAAPLRSDGNTVDLDHEVGALQQNSLLHQTYSQVLAQSVDAMRRALRTA